MIGKDGKTAELSVYRVNKFSIIGQSPRRSRSQGIHHHSLGARSVIVRWALYLGGGALRGSTGALGVWGGAPGAVRTTLEGPAWSSARSMLSCVCRDSTFGASGVAFGREWQSLLCTECSSWQLGQHATNDGQHLRIGSRLPPLEQEGLGQRCSAFVWASEQKGQTGSKLGQRWKMWPNFQHFLHWELLEKNICSTLRFRERRLNERRRANASGGATETTTEVAVF